MSPARSTSGANRIRLSVLVFLTWLTFAVCGSGGGTSATGAGDYDTVILNGRVIDPETGLDSICNIGITGGTVKAISTSSLNGRTSIDAKGLIVSPGFIDIHAHGLDEENNRLQVMDGVTSALELEIGTVDIDTWYAKRDGKSLINYGASIGHVPVRMSIMQDPGYFVPSGPAAHRAATVAEIEQIKRQVEHGLERGAPAVGFGIQYTPAASRWEILEVFRVAARHSGTVAHVHIRHYGIERT